MALVGGMFWAIYPVGCGFGAVSCGGFFVGIISVAEKGVWILSRGDRGFVGVFVSNYGILLVSCLVAVTKIPMNRLVLVVSP